MGLIDRLLLREILQTLFIIVLVLALVLFSSTLVRYLGKAASGALSADILLLVVGLELVRATGLIIPPAFFFSVLWVLGRMHRDSEIVALEAAGFSQARLLRSIMLVALPLAVIVAVLVMELLPWARGSVDRLKAEQANTADISGVRQGRFSEFSRGGLVVYTERLGPDGSRLEGVFVQDRQQGRLGLVTAEGAFQTTDPETGERFVILTDGHRYEGTPGALDYSVGSFEQYAVRIPTLGLGVFKTRQSAKPWQALLASGTPRDWAEFQFRLSMPLALLGFAILAVPLARSSPRSGIYGRLTLAVLIYFTFMNLQRVAEQWLETGWMPAWLGMWWLPLVMLGFAGLMVLLDSNWFSVHWRRRLTWRAPT
ncbi:MAG: LPS export ABC transporter permease LptF [Sedimenticolaceae bacterium]